MVDGILACEDFEAHLDTVFTLIDPDGSTVELVLIGATANASFSRPGEARTPFSLHFKSAEGLVRPQYLYPLQHPEMGNLDVFLVPIAKDETGVTYEACFN
jgi:hypothetical protein